MKEQTESFLNQSIRDWRSSKELRLRQTAYRVPPLGGGSGFSRTTWLVHEPLPPKGGTLYAVCRSRSSFGKRQSRLLLFSENDEPNH